jgi:hypothetical protein
MVFCVVLTHTPLVAYSLMAYFRKSFSMTAAKKESDLQQLKSSASNVSDFIDKAKKYTEINIHYRDIGLIDNVAKLQEEQEMPGGSLEVA